MNENFQFHFFFSVWFTKKKINIIMKPKFISFWKDQLNKIHILSSLIFKKYMQEETKRKNLFLLFIVFQLERYFSCIFVFWEVYFWMRWESVRMWWEKCLARWLITYWLLSVVFWMTWRWDRWRLIGVFGSRIER